VIDLSSRQGGPGGGWLVASQLKEIKYPAHHALRAQSGVVDAHHKLRRDHLKRISKGICNQNVREQRVSPSGGGGSTQPIRPSRSRVQISGGWYVAPASKWHIETCRCRSFGDKGPCPPAIQSPSHSEHNDCSSIQSGRVSFAAAVHLAGASVLLY
jgi:hypothetical protein